MLSSQGATGFNSLSRNDWRRIPLGEMTLQNTGQRFEGGAGHAVPWPSLFPGNVRRAGVPRSQVPLYQLANSEIKSLTQIGEKPTTKSYAGPGLRHHVQGYLAHEKQPPPP
jgi:hypothetical protein